MPEPAQAPRSIGFGPYTLSVSARELQKNGTKVRLPEQPFQILLLLLQQPGEVVTRDELRQRLWSSETFVDFETGLNNAVKKLRDVLGDSAETPRFVETIPRRGYRFICPVNAAQPPAEAQALRPMAWWRRYLAAGVVLLVGGVGLLGMLAFNVSDVRERLLGWGGPPITSLAVLPLKNVSGDPSQDAFAAGMTDVLITELSRISTLQVRSYQSIQQYRNSTKPMGEIARELKVEAVMEGSFAVEGDRIRLTLQLIRASPETHLWAENYTRDKSSALTLQNVLSRDVASELRLKLTPVEKARLASEQSINPVAYEASVVGRYHFHEGTEGDRRLSAELFEKATQADPGYALPYAYLALLYAHGGGYLAGGGTESRMEARAWANKALELDKNSAEAHTALGWLELADWNWRGADDEFQRAIALNPNFPLARTWYAQYLSAMRRSDEAFVQSQRALELAPRDADLVTHASVPYYEAGRMDEAMTRWRGVIERDPKYWAAHTFLARAYILKGMYQEAIAELQLTTVLRNPGKPRPLDLGLEACARARAGRRAEALKIVEALERRAASDQNKGPYMQGMALAYAALGEKDKALAWLENGFERRGEGLFFLNSEPLYGPLRSDPRFQDLLQRIFYPTEKDAPRGEASGKTPAPNPEDKRK